MIFQVVITFLESQRNKKEKERVDFTIMYFF